MEIVMEMKCVSPSVGLMALWAGKVSLASDLLKELAISEMTVDQQWEAIKLVGTMKVVLDAMDAELKKARGVQ
jgi:hypothetical protein